jgi:hypothetical protein
MSRAPCWPGAQGRPRGRQVVGTAAWGAESCHKSPPPDSWNFFRKWVWLAGIYAQQAANGAASIWLAPSRAVTLLAYAVGSWVAKGASIMAVVVVGGGCRTAWAWAGLAKTGLQRILLRIRHHHLQHGRMTGTGCSHMGRLLALQYAGDICRQRGRVCFQQWLLLRRGCSDPGVAEIVDISACFGDVQFPRWVHGAHAGQASLAMEPLPDASCHVCGRQLVFTARCGTEA